MFTLGGAILNVFSDEDGLGFTVSAPNEVVYKLKAADGM